MHCQWEGWSVKRSWEGMQPGQQTPSGQRDIPYGMASCSAYKAGRKADMPEDEEEDEEDRQWHILKIFRQCLISNKLLRKALLK